MTKRPTVAYILSRYPLLSETFILRELLELERQGVSLRVYPLRRPPRAARARMHPRVAELRAAVWRAPWLGLRSHAHWMRRRPLRYAATLAAVLWRNRSDWNLWLGAVAYWGKAVALAERIEAEQVDHVHAHYATHPALAAHIVWRLTGVGYSFTAHAHDIFCHRAMLGEKARRARAVVAISRYNRERIVAIAGTTARVEVVRCGVEAAVLERETGQRRAAGGGWPESPLRVLAVGSLQAYKGHRHLVAACARLRARGIAFECRILGGGTLAAALRRQVRELGLVEAVRLEGPAIESEVAGALAWAQVLALPSVRVERTGQMEGIPVVLMEAMAAGVAVVASRLSGIPELVEDGREGLLVAPGDEAGLAAALARLQDAGLRRRLAAAGRAKVGREYDLAANVARLRGLWPAAADRRGVTGVAA